MVVTGGNQRGIEPDWVGYARALEEIDGPPWVVVHSDERCNVHGCVCGVVTDGL